MKVVVTRHNILDCKILGFLHHTLPNCWITPAVILNKLDLNKIYTRVSWIGFSVIIPFPAKNKPFQIYSP